MTDARKVCHVCHDPDAETYEAGGLWWCDGCAEFETDRNLRAFRDSRPDDP